jgi:hypothetical protein
MSQSNGYRKRLVSGRGFDTEREYVHQEYPKYVTNVTGGSQLVQSEDEEKALQAEISTKAAADAIEAATKKGGKVDPLKTDME